MDQPLAGGPLPTEPQPSVGRIVHYISRGSADGVFPSVCRAAIITVVDTSGPSILASPEEREGWPMQPVDLCVLNPSGIFFDQAVERCDARDIPGTWHWPERTGGVVSSGEPAPSRPRHPQQRSTRT